jgi:hypothetical protein
LKRAELPVPSARPYTPPHTPAMVCVTPVESAMERMQVPSIINSVDALASAANASIVVNVAEDWLPLAKPETPTRPA